MTNDGMLSQDEIDALLNISDDGDKTASETQGYISSLEIDALGEIGNISFGSSATTLSTLLNQKVEITTPEVDVIERDNLEEHFTFEPVSIQVNYIEGFNGKNVFVIKAEDAAIISDIMLGGDGSNPDKELTEIHLSAVQESMNQMMGAAATSMSTVFNKKVDISPPSILDEEESKEIFDETVYVRVFFKLTVGNLIDSNMMQLIPLQFAKELVDQLLNGSHDDDQAAVAVEVDTLAPTYEKQITNEEPVSETSTFSMPVKEEPAESQYLGSGSVAMSAPVQQASFSSFENVPLNNSEQRNLDMLMDIPLKVTVELGRTKKSIKDILDLTSGSIIELDKLAGEPVDILVNEKLVAEGEVVVIDENFGVRVTDIISQTDRIKNLK